MGLSSKLFLLAADDTPWALTGAAFMRMLRQEDMARLPDFAGHRVRLASLVVDVADRTPSRVVHRTFSIIDIDTHGLLDVARLNAQQSARMSDFLAGAPRSAANEAPVVDVVESEWSVEIDHIAYLGVGHIRQKFIRPLGPTAGRAIANP